MARLAVFATLLLAALVVGLWARPVAPLLNADQWRSDGDVWTPLLFVLVFGVAALLFVPRPALSAAAGAVFSLPVALPVVVLGTVFGAGVAFWLARLLGRDAVGPWLREGRLETLDALSVRRGFTATVVCRLLPLLPYAVVNYGAGVTRVRTVPFLAGTAVGTLPANIAYVTIGSALVVDTASGLVTWLGFAVAVVVLSALAWFGRRRVLPGAASARGWEPLEAESSSP
ncbi:TVP38/TMEM64 family protein [Allosaccharopolyspora coralli]|nr:VTT domain-containing protein [Allosaccharopolyspora coralli]